MPKKNQPKNHVPPPPAGWKDPLQPQQPLVSGKWLLSAIGIVVALAAVTAYAALCLLFYQGSWQMIYRPSRTVNRTPASIGIAYTDVRFDYTETGKPQLAGWWIPSGSEARYPDHTILLLHDGSGSLADTIDRIQALHALGINIFAFDYRGFGQSADTHPSEKKMTEDADAALEYLTGMRHLPARSMMVYGMGLGANVAAVVAAHHPELPGLILENISPNALTILSADARSHLVPVRLLTEDRFDARSALKNLPQPKLFLERGASPQTEELFHAAAFPKQLFQFTPEDQAKYLDILQRFLDDSLLR